MPEWRRILNSEVNLLTLEAAHLNQRVHARMADDIREVNLLEWPNG